MENTFTYKELDFINDFMMNNIEEIDKSFYEQMYGIDINTILSKLDNLMYEVRTSDTPKEM